MQTVVYEDNGLRVDLSPVTTERDKVDDWLVVRFVAGTGDAKAHSIEHHEQVVLIPDDCPYYDSGDLINLEDKGTYIEVTPVIP